MQLLRPTQEMKNDLIKQMTDYINSLTVLDGAIKVSLAPNVKIEDKEPVLEISPLAAVKIFALVHGMEYKEIAWHGTVVRTKEGFLIEDILVFPQKVTSSTADAIDQPYIDWFESLDDDTFNKLRFHGHSHVKMATSPSGTDTALQSNILNDIKDFYIFGIFNQKYDYWLRIFDYEKGIIYDTEDINLICDRLASITWAKEAIKENITDYEKYNTTPATTTASQVVGYAGSPRSYSDGYLKFWELQGYSSYQEWYQKTGKQYNYYD